MHPWVFPASCFEVSKWFLCLTDNRTLIHRVHYIHWVQEANGYLASYLEPTPFGKCRVLLQCQLKSSHGRHEYQYQSLLKSKMCNTVGRWLAMLGSALMVAHQMQFPVREASKSRNVNGTASWPFSLWVWSEKKINAGAKHMRMRGWIMECKHCTTNALSAFNIIPKE